MDISKFINPNSHYFGLTMNGRTNLLRANEPPPRYARPIKAARSKKSVPPPTAEELAQAKREYAGTIKKYTYQSNNTWLLEEVCGKTGEIIRTYVIEKNEQSKEA